MGCSSLGMPGASLCASKPNASKGIQYRCGQSCKCLQSSSSCEDTRSSCGGCACIWIPFQFATDLLSRREVYLKNGKFWIWFSYRKKKTFITPCWRQIVLEWKIYTSKNTIYLLWYFGGKKNIDKTNNFMFSRAKILAQAQRIKLIFSNWIWILIKTLIQKKRTVSNKRPFPFTILYQ